MAAEAGLSYLRGEAIGELTPDEVRYSIHDLANQIRHLQKLNDELERALLADPDDIDFLEAIAENTPTILSKKSQIKAYIDALREKMDQAYALAHSAEMDTLYKSFELTAVPAWAGPTADQQQMAVNANSMNANANASTSVGLPRSSPSPRTGMGNVIEIVKKGTRQTDLEVRMLLGEEPVVGAAIATTRRDIHVESEEVVEIAEVDAAGGLFL